MITHLAFLAFSLLPQASAPDLGESLGDGSAAAATQERHGRVDWFEGSYAELLEKAAKEQRVILLNFYTDVSVYSRYLDAGAYSDDAVVQALAPVLCFSVDAESGFGKPLSKHFPTNNKYPALIFLDPNGQLRDRISGHKSPKKILPMIERIVSGENTLGPLRRAVNAAPNDLDALWNLAVKYKELTDIAAHDQQIARIRQLDPKGKSLPMHRLALNLASKESFDAEDTRALRQFLKGETYSELLYEGWVIVAHDELRMAEEAAYDGFAKNARRLRIEYHKAHLNAWDHHPKDLTAAVGNHIAWDMYRDWALLDEKQRDMAIQIARAAVAASPKSADLIDTLACLLFNSGQVEEAIKLMHKCIKLAPDFSLWQERLEMFETRES